MSDSKNYPGLLEDLKDNIEKTLMENGLDKQKSTDISKKIENNLRKNWAGMLVYIRKEAENTIRDRNAEIVRQFNGKNKEELCRKYQLSVKQIYKIIRAA